MYNNSLSIVHLKLLFMKAQTPPPGLWVWSSLCSATYIVLMSPVLVTLQIPNPVSNYSYWMAIIKTYKFLYCYTLIYTVDRSVLFFLCNCSNQLLKDKKSKQALFFTNLIFRVSFKLINALKQKYMSGFCQFLITMKSYRSMFKNTKTVLRNKNVR